MHLLACWSLNRLQSLIVRRNKCVFRFFQESLVHCAIDYRISLEQATTTEHRTVPYTKQDMPRIPDILSGARGKLVSYTGQGFPVRKVWCLTDVRRGVRGLTVSFK